MMALKYFFVLLSLLCTWNLAHAQAPCSAEQVAAFTELLGICKTFPQTLQSLGLGVAIIEAFPSGLAGNTTEFQEAFDAIALMFADLFNISLQIASPSDVQAVQLYPICYIYNELSATPLAPFITIENLGGLLEVVQEAVLNALTAQPAAANFSTAYYTNNAPGAVRLALVPGGMTVSWQTLGAYAEEPEVKFGTHERDLNGHSKGTSHTYGTAYFHDVVLKNLNYDETYYYTIVGDVSGAIYNFTTALESCDKPFVATILGDMGFINAGDTRNSVLDLLPKTDLLIHIGDISYADNYYMRPEYSFLDTYEQSWNIWQQWMMPITSAAPYMVLPGNHEAACQLFLSYTLCPVNQQNFTAYRHRFRMPSVESGAGTVQNMWSSFDYGLAHFVMIDTETDYSAAPEGQQATTTTSGPFGGNGNPTQLAWLEEDLAKASRNRRERPWIIVLGHRPIYTGILPAAESQVLDGFNYNVPAAFESILDKYKVDVYFAGHLHFYERLYPITANVSQQFPGNTYTNPISPTYIVNGAAGNDERHTFVEYNYTLGSFYNNVDYGFGKLYIHNKTHLQWEYIRSSDRTVNDTLWLIHDHHSTHHHGWEHEN